MIRLKKTKWVVNIIVPDSTLWIGHNNLVQVLVKGGKNYKVEVDGGLILSTAAGFIVKVKEEGAATIAVYEKFQDQLKVIYTQLFPVKKIPDPVVHVCSVAVDSVIDREELTRENIITCYHPFYKMQLNIVSFEIVLASGKTNVSLKSNDCHFNVEMKKWLYSIPSGTVVNFENVCYQLPDGSIRKVDDFQIFVSESNKYKVGVRKWGL